jgi:AcrR family transcriptional regulator
MQKEKRRYSGQSFVDRQQDRRAKLVRAALDLAGEVGLEGLSVAAICAEAGLTARYFYESFPNREAMFVAAYRFAMQELFEDIMEHVDPKHPIESALTGFYATLKEHPGQARVFLVDIDDSSAEMKDASREGAEKFRKLFAPNVKDPLQLAGILGAIIQIAKRWIDTGFAEPVKKVVETAVGFTEVKA